MDPILYEVKGKSVIITLNQPDKHNALTYEQFELLDKLVQSSATESGTVVTLIQSTGQHFSTGAEISSILSFEPDKHDYFEQRKTWLFRFAARNYSITNTFMQHPKVLVVALNGPAIGLPVSLIAMCDFVYAVESAYILAPFANIGLVSEGGASYSLVQRLGLSKANEALLASKPIWAGELEKLGFVNKLIPAKSTSELNRKVYGMIHDTFHSLDQGSLLSIKRLIRTHMNASLVNASHQENMKGTEVLSHRIPQKRFRAIIDKKLKHKL